MWLTLLDIADTELSPFWEGNERGSSDGLRGRSSRSLNGGKIEKITLKIFAKQKILINEKKKLCNWNALKHQIKKK